MDNEQNSRIFMNMRNYFKIFVVFIISYGFFSFAGDFVFDRQFPFLHYLINSIGAGLLFCILLYYWQKKKVKKHNSAIQNQMSDKTIAK